MTNDRELKGEGTDKNLKEAVEYWNKAISLGDDYNSLVNLGYFYLNGIEISKNINKAKELYKKACNLKTEARETFQEYSTYGKTACEVANNFM